MQAAARVEAVVPVQAGGIVLVDERKPELSYRLLQDPSKAARPVLCITREPPERVARRHPMAAADHYWLITNGGERCVDPYDLGAVQGLIGGFVAANPEGTVLIDGIELLMVMNSYEEVRHFLRTLQSALLRTNAECVIPIDSRTLTTRELAEMRTAFPMVRGSTSE